MRVLLDACVPRRFRDHLPKYEVRTAQQMGWGNLDDGPLLDAMANHFDALVTVDKGLAKQQNINARPFGLVVLRPRRTGWLIFFLSFRNYVEHWRHCVPERFKPTERTNIAAAIWFGDGWAVSPFECSLPSS